MEAVADRGLTVGRRRADMVRDTCVHRDLAAEVGGVDAVDATLAGNWKEMVDMGFWMLEAAGLGHSEQIGSYQDSLVADQAALVVKRRMDSDGQERACLALRDNFVEDSPGMARDGRLATHFDAYHGPNVMLGHESHDGTQGVRLRQTHPAIQRKVVEGRKQRPPLAFHNDRSRPSGTPTSETCPYGHACHVLPPFGQAIPLFCVTYLAGPFESRTRQRPLAVVCSAVLKHLAVAMASEQVALATAAQWLGE